MAYLNFLTTILLLECASLLKALSLHGDFNAQVAQIVEHQRLTDTDLQGIDRAVDDTERVLRTRWPGSKLEPFGSIVAGLGSKHSDVDALIVFPGGFNETGDIVHEVKTVLEQYPQLYSRITVKTKTRVPTVTAHHKPSHREIDLSFTGASSVANTRLIKYYMTSIDDRILEFTTVIKYWAQVRKLSTGAPNYLFTLMTIFFLQLNGVVPPVSALQKDVEPVIVDHWNVAFNEEPVFYPRGFFFFDLLRDFFAFYGHFAFDKKVVSPFAGYPVYRSRFEQLTLPKEFELYTKNVASGTTPPFNLNATLCVQESFDLNRNRADDLSEGVAELVQAEFARASRIVLGDITPSTILKKLTQR